MKLREVSSYAEDIPGVLIIHEAKDFRLVYMSPIGLKLLGRRWDEIKGMTGEQYH